MSDVAALADGWTLWRTMCLRAAGFPARWALGFADPALDDAFERLRVAESARDRVRDEAIAAAKAIRSDDRAPAQRAIRTLYKHRVPDRLGDPAFDARRDALDAAVAEVDAWTRTLADRYAAAARETSDRLREISANDRFRQAMLWQNRNAVQTGVEGLLRAPVHATDSKTRGNERLVASYVQRYCVKNDTIGFFGPVGWARLGDREEPYAQQPGPSLIERSTVYFEYWAIDALAKKLTRQFQDRIPPRLLPQLRIDGTTLHMPVDRRAQLPDEFAAVARLCDGRRTPAQIAAELAADPSEVIDIVTELQDSKIVTWELEVPTHGHRPERALRGLLERTGIPTAELDELERLREVVAAAHTAAEVDASLQAFAKAFTAIAEVDSQRALGQTYAARTPLYQDCRRALDVELGAPVVTALVRPLALVLQSARWYSHEIARRYRAAFDEVFDRLGGARISWEKFWQAAVALFPGGKTRGSIVAEVKAELHRRWADVLRLDPAVAREHRTSEELAAAVAQAFAAPGPGWPSARHHSPDVLIAADGTPILGELHSGFNTVTIPLFVKEHPQPQELIDHRDRDLERPTIAPVWSKAITRGDTFSLSARDFDFEAGASISARDRDHVLVPSELIVERDGNHLVVRGPVIELDVIAFVEQHLIAESFAEFSIARAGDHGPRITIDKLVVARESWRCEPASFEAWAKLEQPVERFIAAKRWASQLGLPRWVFAKTPEEVKPVFVDFSSTVFVELFAKMLRGASAVSLSEMLPTADQAWVSDHDGERYTSELRVAAVDPVAWDHTR